MLKRPSLHTFLFLVLTTFSSLAQNRTFSPLSRFGLGEINRRGNGQAAGLDHTGIGLSSDDYLNNLNPASYTGLDSLSFLFDAGVMGTKQKISTELEGQSEFNNANFDYMTFGFPLGNHGGMAVGVTPYSSTGYSLYQEDPHIHSAQNKVQGTGDINRFYLGLSIEPLKNLSIGAHTSYLFGNLRNMNYTVYAEDYQSVPIGKYRELHINDFYVDFGLQYKIQPSKESTIIIGATYTPKTNVKANYTSLTVTNFTIPNKNDLRITGDTLEYTNTTFDNNQLSLPEMMGIGFSYSIKDKFTWAADYRYEKWSKTSIIDSYSRLNDSWRTSTGLEWVPNSRNGRSYFERMKYRIGGHYGKEYITVTEYRPDGTKPTFGLYDYGMSFGFSLPIKRSKSTVNLALELGNRSTTDKDVISEKYAKLSFSFTIHEYWFMKSRFD